MEAVRPLAPPAHDQGARTEQTESCHAHDLAGARAHPAATVGPVLVLGICSLKGGVGKTSVTLGLASAALARGLRTLVIDLDPQGDSTMALAPPADPDALDVAAVLDSPTYDTIQRALAQSTWAPEGLDLLRGSESSARHDGVDIPAPTVGHLAETLSILQGYDLVLVDCPPSLGGLTRMGLSACDRAMVVAEPGLFAVMAVGRAMRTIDQLRRTGATRVQPLGIAVNRVKTRSVEQEYRLDELRTLYGPLVLSPVIPERAALQQAQGAAVPIHAWPGAAARVVSFAFDQLLDRALRAPR